MSMVKCPECNGDVSNRAEVCPHCGYPLKPKETQNEEYFLSKGAATQSSFATFLRVIAWITWIGGLIISIAGAQVTEVSSYSYYPSTHFSFTTFLTLFLTYVIYGVLIMGLATVVDQVSGTYSIVSGIRLEKRKEDKTGSSISNSKPSYLSTPKVGNWTCPVCKHTNKPWDTNCTYCSEPRKR